MRVGCSDAGGGDSTVVPAAGVAIDETKAKASLSAQLEQVHGGSHIEVSLGRRRGRVLYDHRVLDLGIETRRVEADDTALVRPGAVDDRRLAAVDRHAANRGAGAV